MEHLTPPGRVAPIIVPYVCTEDYDNDEFISYPMRKGWDLSIWYTYQWGSPLDVARWLPERKSLEDLAAFLQTWLYFGLLASVASVLEAEVELRSFIRIDDDGNPWITTASLPQHVTNYERARENHPESTWRSLLSVIRTNLDVAMNVCHVLGQIVGYGRKEYKTLEVIDFSLELLICSLSRIFTALLLPGKSIQHSPGYNQTSNFLFKQMAKQGWCIFTRSQLQERLTDDMLAYVLACGTVQTQKDHSVCHMARCDTSCIGDSYKPKHLHENCDCELISTPIKEVVKELSTGHIPVLVIEEASNGVDALAIDIHRSNSSNPYIAVSHVWADGLGNPTGNAIFQCQLKDIYKALKSISSDLELVSDHQKSVAFWLDTLCIPVDNELQDLRNFSIQEMRNIYKNASAVLVLDPDLRVLTLDLSHAEVFSRVLSCNWVSRLWTFQEAALSDWLILRGDDCLFYYDKMLEEYDNRASSPRISTSLDIIFATYCQDNIPRRLPAVTEHEDNDIQEMLHEVTNRVTSRPGDETICISTCIGLDPRPLLHTSPENRMRILLEMLPNIPANILFSSGSRIQQEGFRWAPRTLHASPNTIVRRPMFTPDAAKRPMAYLHPDRKGLVTFLPAIQLCGLGLSAFVKASRAYLDMGDGRLNRIGTELEIRVGHSWPEDTQNLAILLPFSGRMTPRRDSIQTCAYGVLIETGRQAAQPSPFKIHTGILSLADYLGTVTLAPVDKDAIEVDINPIHGELKPHRWWLVDGIPFANESGSHGSETHASQVG